MTVPCVGRLHFEFKWLHSQSIRAEADTVHSPPPSLAHYHYRIILTGEMSGTSDDSTVRNLIDTNTSPTSATNKKSKFTEWIRLNHKGIYHDNRRLLKHRAKNCECSVCYREIHKLPPMETQQEYVATIKNKIEEREKKRAKKATLKDVKTGKQRLMDQFLCPVTTPY